VLLAVTVEGFRDCGTKASVAAIHHYGIHSRAQNSAMTSANAPMLCV